MMCKCVGSYFSEEDAILLTASACAIVLRRDLSLSRRLYTWLLGPVDEGKSSVLAREVVELLVRALDVSFSCLTRSERRHLLNKEQSNTSHGDIQDSWQGYRIFIALLDKWEIGYPLSRAYADVALADLRKRTEDTDTVRHAGLPGRRLLIRGDRSGSRHKRSSTPSSRLSSGAQYMIDSRVGKLQRYVGSGIGCALLTGRGNRRH